METHCEATLTLLVERTSGAYGILVTATRRREGTRRFDATAHPAIDLSGELVNVDTTHA